MSFKPKKEKMAFGGETNPKKETVSSMENNPSAGFADGGEVKPKPIIEDSVLEGFRKMLLAKSGAAGNDAREADTANKIDTSSDTATGYAHGGDVQANDPGVIQAALSALSNSFNPMAPGLAQGAANMAQNPTQMSPVINAALGTNLPTQPQGAPDMGEGPNVGNMQNGMAPTPAPQAPAPAALPMGQMMQNLNQTPSTNPGIYQGITSDQRAQLMQSLLAKQKSGGNLAAQAVGGIGDAIANSFGHGGAHAMQDTQDIASKNTENQIGVMDTQRQQKVQDLQANIAQQEADPNSPYSTGMRQFLSQLTGKPMPSGISAAMLKSIFPDYVKIFDSKMQAASATANTKAGIAKDVADKGIFSRILDSFGDNPGSAYQEGQLGGQTPSAAPSSAGWSVKR